MKWDTEFWYSTSLMPKGVRFAVHAFVGKKFSRLEQWQKNEKVAKWAAKDYVLRNDTGPKLDWPVIFTLYESRDDAAIGKVAVCAEWKLQFEVGYPIAKERGLS